MIAVRIPQCSFLLGKVDMTKTYSAIPKMVHYIYSIPQCSFLLGIVGRYD